MESDKSISAPSDGQSEGLQIQRVRPLHGRTSGPARRSTKGQWTAEEDEMLRKAVQRFKGKNWKKIAECFKDRTDVQCLHRWQKVLNPELVKGPWSKEEDEIIIELVNKYGPKKWSTIAQHLPGRIGKQCRERWHNHLNPSINKEAWTQQEELALIRAHQIYGNRWAELTKFLPGRTDNAIKNHWNSSVKKKIDSYLASGLLEQFQGLPLVPYQNQTMPSCRVQSNGDDCGPRCGAEADEISECSQESSRAGCSQSAGGICNALAIYTGEDFQLTEGTGVEKERSSSPPSCSEQYFTSAGDVVFSIPDITCDYQTNLQDSQNISSGFPTDSIAAHESHELENVTFQTSTGLNVATSMQNITSTNTKAGHVLISDDECCRFLFSEAMNSGIFSSRSFTKDSNSVACIDSLNCQSSDVQISEIDKTSQSITCSKSGVLLASCTQSFPSGPLLLTADDSTVICERDPSQLIGHSFASNDQEFVTSTNDGFVYTNGTGGYTCDDVAETTDMQEQHFLKEPSKLVPVNTFASGSNNVRSCPREEMQTVQMEQQDGALCYEPPRFPSLDIPFLSCDLIQSGNDMQQEYSPLGIRQLMMSSMNCSTPYRLWDSPSRDDSPDVLLKSAAKTFTGTPSILKKRNRDLLSPLSDRRVDKKLEVDLASSLTKEFSRLDVVVFDESEKQRAHPLSPSINQKRNHESTLEDKENVDPALDGRQDKGRDSSALDVNKASDKNCHNDISQDNMKQCADNDDSKAKVHSDAGVQTVEQASAFLLDDSLSDLLFSPDQVGFKADKAFVSSSRTPKNLYRRILGTLSEQCIASESSSGNSCILVCSPTISRKDDSHSIGATTSAQNLPSSAPSEGTAINNGKDVATESLSIFGDTPFKRSFESPSAWKSPWFINSFLPGPRVDTDISIEDMGYFMSPGDRSYDAIALMKQLSEQTASTYADAIEVLGNETPETLLGKRRSIKDRENDNEQKNMPENHSNLAPKLLTECRTLDFSECVSPGKGTEKGKTSSAMSFSSSPSSYLLKNCR